MPARMRYVAVDLGAESGRVMLGSLDGQKLELAEIHRFSNGPVREGATLRWDFKRIISEVLKGLCAAAASSDGPIAGVGVNSWGLDFGLLDEKGELIENPYHYRDARTNGMFDEAFKRMPKREIYEHTGIQFMQINSLYQLLAMRLSNDPALARARRLVLIADLVAHSLCGETFAEYTLASTTQMMDMRTGKWSETLMRRLDLPMDILPSIIPPGTVVGRLNPAAARQTGCGAIAVIAAASHDTADAVTAVPAIGDDWSYLSSGTWSLLGVELSRPVITTGSFEFSVTNEGGVEGTIRFLKNIMGLWLVQECKRQWQREGHDFSYAQLTDMARNACPFAARIQPDHPDFLPPGDMPARINRHLEQTGQKPLTDRAEMVRSILESLAFAYRKTVDAIEMLAGRKIRTLHIVGGGSQNDLLNQFAANATGRQVIAGPIEATSAGNVLIQAMAVGQLRSLADIRAVVRNSFPTKCYLPQQAEIWEEEYQRRTEAQMRNIAKG